MNLVNLFLRTVYLFLLTFSKTNLVKNVRQN